LIVRAVAGARGQSRYRLFDSVRDRLHQPRADIEACRLDLLRDLLGYAYRTTRAYRERMDEAGVTADRLSEPGDLAGMAVVTKSDMRALRDYFVSSECNLSTCERKSTSGSSGEPFAFFRDREYFELGAAGMMRCMAVAGWEPGDAVAHCWGYEKDVDSIRKLLGSMLSRTYYLNAFRQDGPAMDRWIRILRKNRIEFIYGYPSSLYWFGQYIIENAVELPMKAVFCTAEKYFGFEREVIEKAFRCKSYDQYGSSEVQNISFECPRGNMHVAEDFVVLQQEEKMHDAGCGMQDGDTPGTARLVVTSLHSRCMPFIRYDLGDFGCLLEEECGCGINTPLMRIDGGSKYDFLTTPDGRVHGAVLERVFNKVPGVVRYQIVQHAETSYTVRCELAVGGGGDTKDMVESSAGRVLAETIGREVDIAFEYPERLDAGPNGKYRFIWREAN